MNLEMLTDVTVRGVRVDAPVRRQAGAGPSDDGHVRLAGRAAALRINRLSPYAIVEGQLLFDGVDTGVSAEPVVRPRFYDLTTVDGVRYDQLARLHGTSVLATTVIQTCVRYGETDRCRFCAIEASLAAGATTRVKTPAQLAEVAAAAVQLDGITQMLMTTGTTSTPDRGARYLARCAAAVSTAVPGLPIQVQCEPPDDLEVFADLRAAGVTAIGIHIESLDEDVRRRWTPGKATIPMATYAAAWREAVRVFGRNRVSTYLLVGLGEDPEQLIDGARALIAMGVYPFVVPFRPLAGTLAAEHPAPEADVLSRVTTAVAADLVAAGMLGADQTAGCAACGACSTLAAAGG